MIRAFTLIETLCVIAIISVLAALLFPVGASAIRSAHASSSMSNLHQLQVAFAMYRTECGGDGVYGRASAMGLPDMLRIWDAPSEILPGTASLWASPCGKHFDTVMTHGGSDLDYHVSDMVEETWAEYARKREEASVLLYDLNCNDASVRLHSVNFTKKVIGVRLAGNGFVKMTRDTTSDLSMWDRP